MPHDVLTPAAITALVYGESEVAARVLRAVGEGLAAQGRRVAGLLQSDATGAPGGVCAMVLENLSTGRMVSISEDLGPGASGCTLVVGQLLAAAEEVATGLDASVDLLLLNKFGKTEGEGGGLRALIAKAMEMGIPILIAVPQAYLEAWRGFAGDFAVEIPVMGENDPSSALIAQFLTR